MQLNGFNQKDLADRMNKKPSEINKWLKGNHNLTLKTIARLEAELGDSIICAVQSKRKRQSV
jgi:transcriptional regulator with XRE-family HTH domain